MSKEVKCQHCGQMVPEEYFDKEIKMCARCEERYREMEMGSCSGCPYYNGCPSQNSYNCPNGF